MASIGHIAVGLLIGRAVETRSTRERLVTMGLFGGMGLLPDADAVLVAAGSDYHGDFGHRGFSHSLLFAASVAAVTYLVSRRWGTKPKFTALLAFLAVASHGLMDAMTYRTRGIPFFWPLTDERFTLPWRPIPPAPFGGHFLSQRGLDVMGIEMIYFLPLTLVALAPSFARLRIWFAPLFSGIVERLSRWLGATGNRVVAKIRQAGAVVEQAVAAAPVPVPVPVEPQRRRARELRRGALRIAGVVTVFVCSLAFAQAVLRDSRAVAWLESAHDQTIAVSLQRQPEFQHLR
ncbi:MAG TPA: metal-dependent hydrolase [Polyangia bacterium]